jgi:hypothetical protein
MGWRWCCSVSLDFLVLYLKIKEYVKFFDQILQSRYITDSLLQKLDNQDEKFVFETNKMNSELVKSLQFQDGAYSLAQTNDGLLLGVKFGIVWV